MIKSHQLTKKDDLFSDDIFSRLREVIYKKCGIHFADSKKYFLQSRISKRLKECNLTTFEEYYQLLKEGSSIKQKKELATLVNFITVNETSFFRNEPLLNAFAHHVLPAVIEENKNWGKMGVKIWSAGCSTGEEPYTLALIVREITKFTGHLQIMATDINDNALNTAKVGKYKDNTLRNVPVLILEKHFTYDGGTDFLIKNEIKRVVTFRNVNLLDEKDLKFLRDFDIVFCRNVIIYFDTVVKKKVIQSIHDRLRKGGYLFIGHSESLHTLSSSFKQVNFERAQAYKRVL